MILYLLASISLSYIYYYILKCLEEDIEEINQFNIMDEYHFYKNINKNIKNKMNLIDNINIDKMNLIKWKNNIKLVNEAFYKNNFKKKYNNVLNDITNNNHLIYWIYKNNISFMKKYNTIVFNFKTIYCYDTEKLLSDTQHLNNIAEYAHRYKIIFIIISELNPSNFTQYEPKYFNKNNHITPYHYKMKLFGSIQKLESNKLANKPASVSINRIILDIMNRYGCNNDTLLYIDNETLYGIDTHIYNFNS